MNERTNLYDRILQDITIGFDLCSETILVGRRKLDMKKNTVVRSNIFEILILKSVVETQKCRPLPENLYITHKIFCVV